MTHRSCIDEDDDEDHQENDDQDSDDVPFVMFPDDELQSFPG